MLSALPRRGSVSEYEAVGRDEHMEAWKPGVFVVFSTNKAFGWSTEEVISAFKSLEA